MDIKEEKDAYLSELLAREAISQDEFDDIIFSPSVNAFDSNYLSARFIDNINWGWSSWQAAKAQAVPDQVLDAPACVGGGTFQKGVKWSTVIGAAQRHYENDGHHEAPAICIRDQLRVASGHSVVVPKEPTYEMLEAGSEARSRTEGHIASIWEAMIEAQEPADD